MAAVTDFDTGGRALGLPLSGLITSEMRKGKPEEVIEKSLVELSLPSFEALCRNRERWAREDFSAVPAHPAFGITGRQIPISVALDQGYADYKSFKLGEERKIEFE